MAQPPARNVYLQVLKNFINSFKIGRANIKANFIGKDHLGNKYYETPGNPSIGKRKANRYFEPTIKEKFDQELPAEWEAWLRNRRTEPPTEEEINHNLKIIEMKQKNSKLIDEKFKTDKSGILQKPTTGLESFPQYSEYQSFPGDDKK
ncbi:NADH dehydrogenase [ubiquinone] 1 alpha subcomplex assembly factor 2 [Ctenocephalides felis]|uniref:NADH dehydrogenase [ubiquinone] 1 alpha subcomplex assembly factor 2 n=1 Tax=Ctenocephalides felis TaxID=7515 RepID=UPI000E6E35E4|nr:NADH dehydrogenase [ubiquinone] 1 alpha subcomplex assembly factor 2 [Ctenocephalides felis]